VDKPTFLDQPELVQTYELEGDKDAEVLGDLYDFLICGATYGGVMENQAAELGMRMSSMENATKVREKFIFSKKIFVFLSVFRLCLYVVLTRFVRRIAERCLLGSTWFIIDSAMVIESFFFFFFFEKKFFSLFFVYVSMFILVYLSTLY
jgi:hypothetical protein